jgi:hypothetical protein
MRVLVVTFRQGASFAIEGKGRNHLPATSHHSFGYFHAFILATGNLLQNVNASCIFACWSVLEPLLEFECFTRGCIWCRFENMMVVSY